MESVHRRLLNEEDTKSSYIPKTSFDTNMVIVLAALLCALIFALGLNLIVKYCATRCRPRQGEPASSGLKKRALLKIPVAVFGSEMDFPASECTICLGEFFAGEKMRVLPMCKHVFHVKCIDRWLISNSSCPICRCALHERPTISLETQVVAP